MTLVPRSKSEIKARTPTTTAKTTTASMNDAILVSLLAGEVLLGFQDVGSRNKVGAKVKTRGGRLLGVRVPTRLGHNIVDLEGHCVTMARSDSGSCGGRHQPPTSNQQPAKELPKNVLPGI
ncbi:hypothetical protein IFR05_006825 [Cadophora sp. M221]|nr:hypothetical protein IFR05_006825 [Cadophora sp. M221]